MTTCDTVTITVAHTAMGETTFSLPAFTRDPIEFGGLVADSLVAYLDGSARTGQPVSLADFVLFMIRIAAQDPHEQ